MSNKIEKQPEILVVMGSASDHPTMQTARDTLSSLGIVCEYRVASAHRAPEEVRRLAVGAVERGIKVVIAGAGGAAHLPGVIASHTALPVIGVPMNSTLQGLDSLLSIAQMPGGVPVATMALGRAGAKNAALLAAQILALSDAELAARLSQYRQEQAESSLAANLELEGS